MYSYPPTLTLKECLVGSFMDINNFRDFCSLLLIVSLKIRTHHTHVHTPHHFFRLSIGTAPSKSIPYTVASTRLKFTRFSQACEWTLSLWRMPGASNSTRQAAHSPRYGTWRILVIASGQCSANCFTQSFRVAFSKCLSIGCIEC